MNESMLICLSIACLSITQRYLERGGIWRLLALAAISALVGAIKLPYLIVWAPIAGLFVEHFGWRGLWRPDLLAVFGIDLAIGATWYTHAHRLGAETGLTFGMTDKLFDASIVFSLDFPLQIGRQLFKDVFGASLLFFLIGCTDAWKHRRLFELFTIAGYVVYLLMVARGNYIHDYYQLPIVVVAPVITALGVVRTVQWLGGRQTLLLGVIVASTLLRSVSAHSWYEIDPNLAQACEQSAGFLRPEDRLVFPDNSDPSLMFCMDRKGWLLPAANSHARELREVTAAGATVGVVLRENSSSEGAAWVAAHGVPIFQNPALTVYRLAREEPA